MPRLMMVLPPGELDFIKSSEVQIIQSPGGILARVLTTATFPPLNGESRHGHAIPHNLHADDSSCVFPLDQVDCCGH